MGKRVLVAMSGGVDSTVAALLLKRAGYEAGGVMFQMFPNMDRTQAAGGTCGSAEESESARSAAAQLGMDFSVLDCSSEFREQVMDRFADAYLHGATPNPCIVCNRFIKFAKLFQLTEQLQYDCFATGHYARTGYDAGSGRWLLRKGSDPAKDQSYVLYSLTQAQLSRTIFPVGELTKKEIRQLAAEQGLHNAEKPDSQDICFIRDGDYAAFLRKEYNAPSEPGDFVDGEGRVLGKHSGHIAYTLGQRRGLGVSADRPLYVIGKDLPRNRVILGDDRDLYVSGLVTTDLNYIAISGLASPLRAEAKIRYSQKTASARLIPMDSGDVRVEFDAPQRAPTPGQAVVFYDGDVVLGGGTIR